MSGRIDEYCVARLTTDDGRKYIGKGPTREAALDDLWKHKRRADAFENDNPMPDWSKLPMDQPPAATTDAKGDEG